MKKEPGRGVFAWNTTVNHLHVVSVEVVPMQCEVQVKGFTMSSLESEPNLLAVAS
jgi:hypothetical protein